MNRMARGHRPRRLRTPNFVAADVRRLILFSSEGSGSEISASRGFWLTLFYTNS